VCEGEHRTWKTRKWGYVCEEMKSTACDAIQKGHKMVHSVTKQYTDSTKPLFTSRKSYIYTVHAQNVISFTPITKTTTFLAQLFTKLTKAQQHNVENSYTKLHRDRSSNIESTVWNSFLSLLNEWLWLSQFHDIHAFSKRVFKKKTPCTESHEKLRYGSIVDAYGTVEQPEERGT